MAELRAEVPGDTRLGFDWFSCPVCREPMLIERGKYDRSCISTPRCKGKLNPDPVGPKPVKGRR